MTAEEVLETLSNAAEPQVSALAQLEKYSIPVSELFTSEMRDRFNEEMATFVQSSRTTQSASRRSWCNRIGRRLPVVPSEVDPDFGTG
jgi:hypothetical protein